MSDPYSANPINPHRPGIWVNVPQPIGQPAPNDTERIVQEVSVKDQSAFQPNDVINETYWQKVAYLRREALRNTLPRHWTQPSLKTNAVYTRLNVVPIDGAEETAVNWNHSGCVVPASIYSTLAHRQ